MNDLRAVGYVRCDSRNDESKERQISAIENYAQQNEIKLVGIYLDRGESGMTDKRPEFQRMINEIKLKNFNQIIVHGIDRFSRNKFDLVKYKVVLKHFDVKLISILEPIDDSPESLLMESIYESMAEFHSKNLSREVMRGLKETAMRCKFTGGILLFGYDIDPTTKNYVINEQEAKIVKLIYSSYLNDLGYNKIIKTLNEKNFNTKRGEAFSKNFLYTILRNEKYTGVFVYKSSLGVIRIENGLPAIITKVDFEKVQNKIESNKLSKVKTV